MTKPLHTAAVIQMVRVALITVTPALDVTVEIGELADLYLANTTLTV
jgi:hypothetical protein